MPLVEHEEAAPEVCAQGAGPHQACVAIPARNEEARIGACLQALAAQTADADFAVVILANNCTDATADIVRAFGASAPFEVHLYEAWFDRCVYPAARARRLSMNAAAQLVAPRGAVLTTDADSRADAHWVDANLRGLRAADLVCGAIAPDLWELGVAFPDSVLQRGAIEFTFEQMAAEMEHLVDPLPWDPWPHHRMETGASIALSAPWLTRVGGVPELEPGEDRALVNLVRRAGGRVRHAPDAQVITSCRLDGRARGGWADDLRARIEDPTAPCHDVLEPALDLHRRAKLRAAWRAAWPQIDVQAWARSLRLAPDLLGACLNACERADAWCQVEAVSPRLRRARLQFADLPRETERVRRLLARARRQTRARVRREFA